MTFSYHWHILSCAMLAVAVTASIAANENIQYGTLSEDQYDRPGSIDSDIKKMVARMTLEEKIGQMTQLDQSLILQPDGTLNRTAVKHYAQEYYVGSYLNQLGGHGMNFDHAGYAKIIEEIQEITLSVNTTFKIPIIYGLDNIHGAQYIANSTIFPHGINLAASFNPTLAYDSSVITARDTRAASVHWTFAPVLDIPVNKQWPRVYENFGEDPLLSSVMGVASIRGYQGKYKTDRSKVAACMKHFIAYGAPWTGEDRDSSIVSDRTLMDYFVPGFQAAIDAGVATAMEAYSDINGEPVVASQKYLRELLREQMQFKGMLVTDWAEIQNLHTTHRVASTHMEAVRLSIGATSVDMSMVPNDVTFFEALRDLVHQGAIELKRIDESAERLLQLKKDLGLLEPDGWRADLELQKMANSPEDEEVSKNAARESITLLKNQNETLPLSNTDTKRILVMGPTGNDFGHLAGGWTINWQGATKDGWHGPVDDHQFYTKGTTIYQGIVQAAPNGSVVDYMPGFDIDGTVPTNASLDDVLKTAGGYDIIIACIGEHVYTELPGNIHDIRLPAGQIDVIRQIAAAKIPLVTVLVEGRPRVLDTVVDHSNALLHAYLPGPWGGVAIGEILFGQTNPSGRLPYTYPKHVGDQSLTYWRQVNEVWDPQFEFGHGMSYSRFQYSNMTLSTRKNDSLLVPGESNNISITVTNDGPYDGKEVVLMYIQQPFRRVTPPAKLLKGFQKVNLRKGESVNVHFTVSADMFVYTGLNNTPTIDNGPVKVIIGGKVLDLEISA